jgi:uncharacterized protein YutE (UPF0331/DUF86 family)
MEGKQKPTNLHGCLKTIYNLKKEKFKHTRKYVDILRDLGVILDENLGWHDHIENIAEKVKRLISVLRKIRDSIPIEALLKVYHAIVQPHFDYCSSVWDNCNKGLN